MMLFLPNGTYFAEYLVTIPGFDGWAINEPTTMTE